MTGNLGSLRPRPLENGPLGYYWFLTFDHASELHSRTKECQEVIDPAHFKTTPTDGLHLTLDRISRPRACTVEQRVSIAVAAQHACRGPLPLSVRPPVLVEASRHPTTPNWRPVQPGYCEDLYRGTAEY
ncbi:hypothetical protein ACWFRF_02265 [Nocardia sp. NPDC055165]